MNKPDYHLLLDKVQKPARYLGGEINAVYKPPDGLELRLALAFPDLYEVGMSHLGLKILYGLVNNMPGMSAERVFAPGRDMEELLQGEKLPLFSLEGKTPLCDFDLVGFTIQYELSYTAILNMLELGGIPLRSEERKRGDPFIIGGGPCVFNPEPLAPFFDIFVIGDGEGILPELLQEYLCWKRGGEPDRQLFLSRVSRLSGIYVPSFYEPSYVPSPEGGKFSGIRAVKEGLPSRITKRTVDLEQSFYPEAFLVPYMKVVHDRAMLELFRGCTQGCRFCQAGIIYRPVRNRSIPKLKNLAGNIIAKTGFEELSLSSLSTSDYPGIEQLVDLLHEELAERDVQLSLPSLRADKFSLKLADRVKKNRGGGGVTFAPEAGTQRLRDVINKKITQEEILDAAGEAISSGKNHIKLYFMIGLPTEKDEDLEGIIDLVKEIMAIYQGIERKKRGPFRLTVSASTFVPKSHTPFQWEPQIPPEEIRRRQGLLRRGLRFNRWVNFTWHDAEMSLLEATLARGDRRLAPVLENAFRAGSRLDAWSDEFSFALWQEAFKKAGIDPGYYAGLRPGYDDLLPWDHIDTKVSKEFLKREHMRAIKGELTDDCRTAGCRGCGIKDCPGIKVGGVVLL
ncbi:MAG: TIGR03960 family B12-binding radical SAM protein [Dethiobacteria bacterium]|jgi:radical SAM family uncharacterized protein